MGSSSNRTCKGRSAYRFGAAAVALSAAICLIAAPGQAEMGAASQAAPSNSAVPASPTGVASPAASLPPSPYQPELSTIINAGTLPDLSWPNFTDYRPYLQKFYETGGYALAWSNGGKPVAQASVMIEQFKQAQFKGLTPEDYDASRWDARVGKLAPAVPNPAPSDLVHFDVAMTVAAMRYVSDLHIGRINPKHFKFALGAGPHLIDLPDFLRTQLLTSQDIPALIIGSVERPHAGYRRVEAALGHYLNLAGAGDGPPVPTPSKSVRPGDTFAGMPQLVARLHLLGDLESTDDPAAQGSVYEGVVVDAVKHFQNRHGLEPDGVIGQETIARLNTPLSTRATQLALALERYRWLPPDFPQPPIIVNIPEFKLRTLRRGEGGFLTMNVVVGRAYQHKTPVFAQDMRYVIFHPYWNVPASIANAELYPKEERDPSYFAEHGFEEFDGQLRQKPGAKNALGPIKFVFPNSYNVYLHGTPAVSLFSRARRDFSHGCIRVKDPVALAAWVLRDQPGWTPDRIRDVIKGTQTVQVNLDKPIPVLILYSTAVVEPDGEVHFFPDIYGYDAELEKALAAGYPYPG